MNIFKIAQYILTHPLNRCQPFSALGRFIRWQLATRLLGAPIALPFVNDTELLMERQMAGATGNWYCGLHEFETMAFVLHLLRTNDDFFDVGANIGSYTVLAAGAAKANVFAVEPIPATFDKLQRNIRLNDLSVRALCCGLSDSEGELRFITDGGPMNRVALEDERENTVIVPVTTLDKLDGKPRLIKIDVEGHEMAVLSGAHRTLSSPELLGVIMETNGSSSQFGISDAQLVGKMKSYGFRCFRYDPFNRELIAAPPSSSNTIFARDTTAINDLCRTAAKFQLCNGLI